MPNDVLKGGSPPRSTARAFPVLLSFIMLSISTDFRRWLALLFFFSLYISLMGIFTRDGGTSFYDIKKSCSSCISTLIDWDFARVPREVGGRVLSFFFSACSIILPKRARCSRYGSVNFSYSLGVLPGTRRLRLISLGCCLVIGR